MDYAIEKRYGDYDMYLSEQVSIVIVFLNFGVKLAFYIDGKNNSLGQTFFKIFEMERLCNSCKFNKHI